MSAPTWFDEAMRLVTEYAISHGDLARSRDAYSLAALPRAEKALRAHLQGRDFEFEQNREIALKVSGALAREAVVRGALVAALDDCVQVLSEDHDGTDFEFECPSCHAHKHGVAALALARAAHTHKEGQ